MSKTTNPLAMTVYDIDEDGLGCLRLHVNTDVPYYNERETFNDEMADALESVIVRGPELLAQLEAFVEFANQWFGEGQMPEDWKGRCVCANAAITQARGTA